jgi:hypothetical protein
VEGIIMSTSPATVQPKAKKQLTTSILLWVRIDQPRQTGMDYWKGPHSKIISATKGLEEYRQIITDELPAFALSVEQAAEDLP